MRAPDSLTTGVLAVSELWRRSARHIKSGPLYRWRFASAGPAIITRSPIDLRPGEPDLARDYYAGVFNFAGETINTSGRSPFSLETTNTEWMDQLHKFQWLRHLHTADNELARSNGAAFISDWIDLWGNRYQSTPWNSEILSPRLIAWLSHGPNLFHNSSQQGIKKFYKSVAQQSRYLQYNAQHTRDGYPRLISYIALVFSSLCVQSSPKLIHTAGKDLSREISRQILPDGGHISRNPRILIDLLADLIPLKVLYQERKHPAPPELLAAIDRMIGAVEFFKHHNKEFAQFNGTGQTTAAVLSQILARNETKVPAPISASHSGYEKLKGGQTTVIIDTGSPTNKATANDAMAGTLSFELASDQTRFITNCGVPEFNRRNYIQFARATAAHSTATIGDTSSSRYAGDSWFHKFLPSALVMPPKKVVSSRETVDGFTQVTASHDGYESSFGIIHERQLLLSNDGARFNGIDRFLSSRSRKRSDAAVAIRFHLPPQLSASLLSSGYSILVASPNGDAWTFSCVDAPINLEESIYFSGPSQPRKSEQIVIHANLTEHSEIRWTLERRAQKKKTLKRGAAVEPGEAPDLLDALINNEQEA